jgi:hypothetical protein
VRQGGRAADRGSPVVRVGLESPEQGRRLTLGSGGQRFQRRPESVNRTAGEALAPALLDRADELVVKTLGLQAPWSEAGDLAAASESRSRSTWPVPKRSRQRCSMRLGNGSHTSRARSPAAVARRTASGPGRLLWIFLAVPSMVIAPGTAGPTGRGCPAGVRIARVTLTAWAAWTAWTARMPGEPGGRRWL